MTNAGTTAGAASEGGFGQLVSTTTISSGETTINLSFDYVLGANVTLYVHLTGWSNNETTDSPTHNFLNNTGSAGGNIQNQGDTSNYADLDLISGADPNGFNTLQLTGSGNYSASFDVSSYAWSGDEEFFSAGPNTGQPANPGFSGGVTDLTEFDFIQLVFATDITDNTADSALAIDDVLLTTTVPEPSSAALLGLGGLALIFRRRK